jgi:hypothetical protein
MIMLLIFICLLAVSCATITIPVAINPGPIGSKNQASIKNAPRPIHSVEDYMSTNIPFHVFYFPVHISLMKNLLIHVFNTYGNSRGEG